jgi:hypothetical protein
VRLLAPGIQRNLGALLLACQLGDDVQLSTESLTRATTQPDYDAR